LGTIIGAFMLFGMGPIVLNGSRGVCAELLNCGDGDLMVGFKIGL
jgi:hypothetical protein